MKSNHKHSKLRLDHQTVRNLSSADLTAAAGGYKPITYIDCTTPDAKTSFGSICFTNCGCPK